jgi:hypothetical protein
VYAKDEIEKKKREKKKRKRHTGKISRVL